MRGRITALVLVAAMAAGCGGGSSSDGSQAVSSGPPSGTLRLFAYSDGFAKGLIKPFTDANPQVKLETTPFDSVSSATAKLRAGYDTDVVNSCVEEGTINQVKLGLLQPIDTSRIKDWDKIYPTFKKLPGIIVDGKVYMIPIDSGVTGLMYNSDVVTTHADLLGRPVRSQPQGPGDDRGQPRGRHAGGRPGDGHHRPGEPDRGSDQPGQGLPDRAPGQLPHLLVERRRHPEPDGPG